MEHSADQQTKVLIAQINTNIDRLAATARQLKSVKPMLYGLIFECPLGGNPSDCQGHAVRQESLEKRMAFVESLDETQALKLYLDHLECLRIKLISGTGAQAYNLLVNRHLGRETSFSPTQEGSG